MKIKPKNEILEHIKILNNHINCYENKYSESGWGGNTNAPQVQKGRIEYAGWIAHRDMYRRMLQKNYPYVLLI